MRTMLLLILCSLVSARVDADTSALVGGASVSAGMSSKEALSRLENAGVKAVATRPSDLRLANGESVQMIYIFTEDGASLTFREDRLVEISNAIGSSTSPELVKFVSRLGQALAALQNDGCGNEKGGTFRASEAGNLVMFSCGNSPRRIVLQTGTTDGAQISESRVLTGAGPRRNPPPPAITIESRLFIRGIGCLGILHVDSETMRWDGGAACQDPRSFFASANDVEEIFYVDNGLGRWIMVKVAGSENVAEIGLQPGDGRSLMRYITAVRPAVRQSCWFEGSDGSQRIDCSRW